MKKLLKIIFTVFIIVAIAFILFGVKVKNIEVIGNTLKSNEKFIESIFEHESDKISIVLFIKDKLLKHKDLTHVEKYNIEWVTPFTIKIYVYEKDEIGYIKKDISYVYFDKDGVICDVTETRKENIPEIRGINLRASEKGEKIETGDKLLLESILNISNTLKLYKLPFSLLEFGKDGKISVYVDMIKVELGDLRNMEIKLTRLKDIYPEIKDLSGILDLSDAKENMLDERYIFKKT